MRHHIKCIVTAFFLGVGYSLPLAAQESRLDQLFADLLVADAESQSRIERDIVTEWGRSGSAAMDLLLRRGQEALEAGQPEVAVEHFSALVDHAPDFAEGYNGRATSYYMLGLTGPALEDIGHVLALEPRHFGAMGGLGRIMETLGREDDALEIYQMIHAINPASPGVNDAIARLELAQAGQSL